MKTNKYKETFRIRKLKKLYANVQPITYTTILSEKENG